MALEPDRNDRLFLQFIASKRVACPVCGYDLRSGATTTCPECGEAMELYLHHGRWSTARLVLLVSLGLYALVTVLILLLLHLEEARSRQSANITAILTAGAVVLAAGTGFAFWWFRLTRHRARRTETADARAGRLSVLRGLVAAGPVVWCPTRRKWVTEFLDEEWCPQCFERIDVRVRPVKVWNLTDERARWIVWSVVTLLVLVGWTVFIGILAFFKRRPFVRHSAGVGVPSVAWFQDRHLVVMWSSGALCLASLGLATWLLAKRRRLMNLGSGLPLLPAVFLVVLMMLVAVVSVVA